MTKGEQWKTSPFLLSGRFLTQTQILCSSICAVQHMTSDYFTVEGQYQKKRIWPFNSPRQLWSGAGSLGWLGNLGSFAGFRSLELWYRSPEEAYKNDKFNISKMNLHLYLLDYAPELFSPWAPAAEADAFLASPAVSPPPLHSLTSSSLSKRRESKIRPTFSTTCT